MTGSKRNAILGGVVAAAMAGMVGMSFAAVPLYRLFCAATPMLRSISAAAAVCSRCAPTNAPRRRSVLRRAAELASELSHQAQVYRTRLHLVD